jgi:hypothetical protein
MADSTEEANCSLALLGDLAAETSPDSGPWVRDRVPAGRGNPHRDLRSRGNDTALERSGYPGGKLRGDACTDHVDGAARPARWTDVCIGAAAVVGENADARVPGADDVCFGKCGNPCAGSMAGDCRANGGSDDLGVDSGVAARTGASNNAEQVTGERRSVRRY